MYALIIHFSNYNKKPCTGDAPEIDVKTYPTHKDALCALVEESQADRDGLDTDEHPAELTLDMHKGYAHLRIDYPGVSECIDYEVYELKHMNDTPMTKRNETELRPYNVSIAVDARANITVMAKDPQHAKELAEDEFMEFQCGDLEIVDAHPVNCTDVNDDVTDY
ncbi:MAG: hypothetical protein HDQ88_03265 [Clostridia bacterium]|nr:hypothetical protein [Clostridia bacterium]